MADEKVNNTATGSEAGKGEQAKEEMVSKADFEKIQSQLSETTKQTDKLRKERDEAKLEVLNPEYLTWLEQKEKTGTTTRETTAKAADSLGIDEATLEGMSRKEFLKLAVGATAQHLAKHMGPAFDKEIKSIKSTVSDITANLEVKEAEKKYPDFWDYKDQMIDLTKRNDGLRIEDAYKIAKQNIKLEKDAQEKAEALRAQSEKPGGVAKTSTTPKEFKDSSEASEDAWSRIMGDKETL